MRLDQEFRPRSENGHAAANRKQNMTTFMQREKQATPAVKVEAYGDYLDAILRNGPFATKGDRTRFRLKCAAVRVLEEVGYSDLKVSEICAQAEVALGTFYVYFKDKSEIASEVVQDFVEFLYDRATQYGGGGKGAFEAILNTNRFFAASYKRNPGLMRCHVQLQSLLPEFRARWQPRHRAWIERLARSIERRGNYDASLPGNPQAVALALEGMVFFFLYRNIVTDDAALGENCDTEEFAEMLSILWYRSVYGTDPVRA